MSEESPPQQPRDSSPQAEKANEVDTSMQIESVDQDESDSSTSHSSTDESREVVSFVLDDPENPYNWSDRKKKVVVIIGIILVLNSTIGSSIASSASQEFSQYFHNDNQEQLVLPTSIYLVGYVLGPLLFGPLSESYGRKWVMIGTFVCILPLRQRG